jgi:hypothetical protein
MLLDERGETFRHRLFHIRVFRLEHLSECQQPRFSGQDFRTCGRVSHRPFPSRRELRGRPDQANKPTD